MTRTEAHRLLGMVKARRVVWTANYFTVGTLV